MKTLSMGPTQRAALGCGRLSMMCAVLSLIFLARVEAQIPAFDSQMITIADPGSPIAPIAVSWGGVGDIDGDGLDDIVRIDSDLGTLLVARSLGQTLDPSILTFPTSVGGQAVAVGDLDGDADEDVVVAYSGSFGQGIRVHWNDGTGDLSTSTILVSTNPPGSLSLIDITGDGLLDIVGRTQFSSGALLINQGAQSFSGSLVLPATGAFELGDIDGDGIADIVDVFGGNFRVQLGGSTGTFSAPTVLSPALIQPAGGFKLRDFDSDGDLDLIQLPNPIVGTPTSLVVVRRSASGWTTEAPQQVASGSFASLGPIADLNGDNAPDLILFAPPTGGTRGFAAAANNGSGGFTESANVPMIELPSILGDAFGIGDLNGDGRDDVVTFARAGRTLVSYGMVSVGITGARVIDIRSAMPIGTSNAPLLFTVNDFNRDGRLDAIQAVNHPGGIDFIWADTLSGSPSLSVQRVPGVASAIESADIDRDGFQDLIVGSQGALTGVASYLGDGTGSFTLGSFVITPGPAGSLSVQDMNGDGWLDVIATGSATHLIRNNGAGSLLPTPLEVAPCELLTSCGQSDVRHAVVADVNQDGVRDVVVSGISPFLGLAEVERYWGDGAGGFIQAAPLLVTSPGGLRPDARVAVADLNGDGVPDIVHSGVVVEIFIGQGGGQFSPRQSIYTGLPASPGYYAGDMAVGDLNADGLPELVFARGAVLENLGGGFLALRGELATGNVPADLVVADVNGDLQQDIVVSDLQVPGMLVFENPIPCPAQSYSLGSGCPGTGGFSPHMTLAGCAGPSGTTNLGISQGLAGAASALLVGPTAVDLPLAAACNLYVDPASFSFVPISLGGVTGVPGQGTWALSLTWPATIAPGYTLALQFISSDPAAIGGFSSSRGISLTIP